MVKGSVTRTTGQMSERESIEAFVDGAKKCASAARELAKECGDPEWEKTAKILENMGTAGLQLSRMKSMNRLDTLMAANIKSNPKGFLN